MTAVDASVRVNDGIGEALLVPGHGDGVFGAAAGAGTAAGAAVPGSQPGQVRLDPLGHNVLRVFSLPLQSGAEEGQGAFPLCRQTAGDSLPVDGVIQSVHIALANDAALQPQGGKQAEQRGSFRCGQLRRRYGGKKGLLENNGKCRSGEGIRADPGGIFYQGQIFRRAGCFRAAALAFSEKADHRQAGFFLQFPKIGRQGAGPPGAVPQEIPPGGI